MSEEPKINGNEYQGKEVKAQFHLKECETVVKKVIMQRLS